MPSPHRAQSRLESFRYAFSGWWYVFRTQKNTRIHAVATLVVIGLGLWLRLDRNDWIALVVAIGLVWFAEFLNTSLEVLIDLVSPQQHPLAKVVKDVGAGAVLLMAFISLILGSMVLLPPLWKQILGSR